MYVLYFAKILLMNISQSAPDHNLQYPRTQLMVLAMYEGLAQYVEGECATSEPNRLEHWKSTYERHAGTLIHERDQKRAALLAIIHQQETDEN
jgi:hypothetical protein